jgi:hypothetical protein
VGLAWFAEDVGGDDLALVLADVRQLPDAGDVADRPQPLARAQCVVDRDSPWVRGDADGLEPDPLHARAPSGRHEQAITAQLASILESQDEVLAVAGRRGRLHAEDELDSVATQRLAQRIAQRRRLAREHALGRLDDRHLAAQTTHDLCELDTGRPTSEHDQPSGHGLHPGRLVGAPDAVELSQAGHGRDDRIGAVGQDDVVGGVACTPSTSTTPSRRADRDRAAASIPRSASHFACRCRSSSRP